MQSAETLENLQKFLKRLDPSKSRADMLTGVAQQLVEMFDVDHSGVMFFSATDTEGEVVAEYPPQGVVGLRASLLNYPLVDELKAERKPIAVVDAQEDPFMGGMRDTFRALGIKSIAIIPLLVKDKLIGGLGLDVTRGKRVFTQAELELGGIIGTQIAVAIDYMEALETAESSRRQAQTLRQINRVLSESLDLAEVLPLILEQSEKVIPIDGSSIYLLVKGGIQVEAWRGVYSPFTKQQIIPLDDLWGIAEVVRTKAPVLVEDTALAPYWKVDQNSPIKSWLGLPLIARGEVVGVLNMEGYRPQQFNKTHLSLAHPFARQAALAISNARLYGEAQKRSEQWRRVQEITSTLNASLDMDKVIHNACEQVVKLLEVDHCEIIMLSDDPRWGQVVAEYPEQGVEGLRISLDYPAFQQMLRDLQPFIITNVSEGQGLGELQASLNRLAVKSVLVAPLIVQGSVIGSVSLNASQHPHQFADDELNMIRIVADQIAIAITNARTYQAERVARIQADTLREVAAILNETLDLNEVLERILDQIGRVITCDSSSIILKDDGKLKVVATRGFPNPEEIIGLSFSFTEQAPYQEIARTRGPVILQDTLEVAGWQHTGPRPIRSWIGAPLLVSERLVGLLTVDHSQPDFYQQADGELVMAFANLAAIALENARLYQFEVKQVEQELAIAQQIQRGFLPRHIPEIPGWRIAAVCLPARETGGDFYEFVERTDGILGLAVGDVSGKSVPAAMLMAAAQSMVGAKGSDHLSPAKVMSEVNRLLCDDIPRGTFVAMSYALLAPYQPTVYLSNGGQLAPFLVPGRGQPIQLVETPTPRWPMGIMPDSCYQETTVNLEPGDLLVFYTDGLVERKNEKDELFGFERVGALLDELRGQPPEYVLQCLLTAADNFAQGLSAHDDVTLVVAQRVNPSNNNRKEAKDD